MLGANTAKSFSSVCKQLYIACLNDLPRRIRLLVSALRTSRPEFARRRLCLVHAYSRADVNLRSPSSTNASASRPRRFGALCSKRPCRVLKFTNFQAAARSCRNIAPRLQPCVPPPMPRFPAVGVNTKMAVTCSRGALDYCAMFHNCWV